MKLIDVKKNKIFGIKATSFFMLLCLLTIIFVVPYSLKHVEENRIVVFVILQCVWSLCVGFIIGRDLGRDLKTPCSQCATMDKSLEHLEQLLDTEMESNHRLFEKELEARLKIHRLERKIETLECPK